MKVDTSKLGQNIIIFEEDETRTECQIQTGETGQRLVEYQRMDFDSKEKYFLIENQDQIDARIKTGNFVRCIFVKDADFRDATFKKYADFMLASFVKDADFSKTYFEKEVHFNEVTFAKEIWFCKENVNGSTPNQFFSPAKFQGNVWFDGSQFKGRTCFNMVSFGADAGFRNCEFDGKIEFSMVNVKDKFIISNMKVSSKLDLKSINYDYIDYTESDFNVENSANRETLQILKSAAIQQNDQIKALEFHVKEMEKYRKDLSYKQFDWWLLGFEKVTSFYGTKAWLPLFWVVVLQLMMLCFISPLFSVGVLNLPEYLASILGYKFWSHESLELLTTSQYFKENSLLSLGSLKLINSIKNIGIAVLLYEVIKSFRKFSRKL